MPDPSRQFVGRQFGAYQVLSEIARGGQGAVLRARHVGLGTEVALKVLLQAEDPRSVGRFRQEAKVLARLDHPHLLGVSDLGEVDGVPFLAMKFVSGDDLKAIVLRGGIPDLAWTVDVLASIAGALHYCHGEGVIHRDVKPANVLIDSKTTRPMLVDFGLAKRDPKRMHMSIGNLSRSGEMKGTPAFMAPEQADGLDAGPASDVYGLGSTLYFLLTGFAPFQGTSPINVVMAVLSEPPPDPRARNAAVPAALAELCMTCMAKAPEERPQTAEAFAAALRAAAPGRRSDPPKPDTPHAGTERKTHAAIAAGVGFVLLLGVVTFLFAASGPKTVSPERPGSIGVLEPKRSGPKTTPPKAGSIAPFETERAPQLAKPGPATSSAPPGSATPAWYLALKPGERPSLPLPRGVRFASPGEYENTKDGSVLVWIPPASIFIGKFEVTWKQYHQFCREEGVAPDHVPPQAQFRDLEIEDDHPAFNVSWNDAQDYCAWAGLRLPSHREWLLAAGSEKGYRFPWGVAPPEPEHANIGKGARHGPYGFDAADGHVYTSRVGSYPDGASPYGCLDMAGNVFEWLSDAAVSTRYDYCNHGGSWLNGPYWAEITTHQESTAKLKSPNLGLRVALSHNP